MGRKLRQKYHKMGIPSDPGRGSGPKCQAPPNATPRKWTVPAGTADPAEMSDQEWRLVRAWDNQSGRGLGLSDLRTPAGKARTKKGPFVQQAPSRKKYDGKTHNVGPVEPKGTAQVKGWGELSWTDKVQHMGLEEK